MKIITLIVAAASCSTILNAQVTIPKAVALKKKSIATTPVGRKYKLWLKRHNRLVKNANTNPVERKLVFIGDSITQSWEGSGKQLWAENFTQWNALNLGINGDQTQHVLWRLKNGAFPKALKPKVAVVMIGTNNAGHRPAKEIAAGITLIVDEIHKRAPKTQIILHAIFPRGATPQDLKRIINNDVNKIISLLDKRTYVHYVNINSNFLDEKGNLTRKIMPDLLHPKAHGYEIWTNAILPKIEHLMSGHLTSMSGFKAKFVPLKKEGEGKTEIWKAGKKIADIANARPLAFSPKEDILLLKEHMADDDTRVYLLNIGKSEFKMTGNRSTSVFGSRFVTSATWSTDGSKVILKNFPGMSDKETEIHSIADVLKRK